MKEPSSCNQQSGFSLLEVLVAFSILAMSLGLLYRMAGGSARHVPDATQNQQAVWLAESLLASHSSVEASGWNEDGESAGFTWHSRSNRHHSGIDTPQMVPMHKVQLTVYWTSGSRPGQLDLITLLPERKPGLVKLVP